MSIAETARYLLENPHRDAELFGLIKSLLADQEQLFGEWQYGAITMNEQIYWYYPMISHTARYASVCALYYELTGDEEYKEKAYRAYNWSTYGSCPEKERILVETMDSDTGWFTDAHGDYLQHLFAGFGSIPHWAPEGENHLLRSSSMIQSILYEHCFIIYQTYDTHAQEVLRLTTKPEIILVNGQELAENDNLDKPGWTWEPLAKDGICG